MGWKWRLGWRKERFEWEKVLLNQLTNEISLVQLHRNYHDCWKWKYEEDGQYSIEFAYAMLHNSRNFEECPILEFFWAVKAPPNTQNLVRSQQGIIW